MTENFSDPKDGSSEKVKFEDWDWEKNDPQFYTVFKRMPEYTDPRKYDQVKWNRFQ